MTGPRVLMITGEYPPMEGGVADFTAILSRTMADLSPDGSVELHVLTSERAGPARTEGDVTVHPLMRRWGWLALPRAVRDLVARFRLDVVNIQYQSAAYGLHPAINLLPHLVREVPMVVTFHDLRPPYLFPKAGRLRDRAVLALAQGARAVIVTNAQDRQRLVGQHGIRRFEMIPIGSNISATLPRRYDRTVWRMRWNLPEEALVLCYFGFLNASKGGEDLVYALRRLVDGGLDAWLLMIGGAAGASDPTNRVYLQHVRRAIDTLHLADRVVWTGHLADEEVSACFALADICVLPYRDGLSFRRGSLIAALVHGMPIISTYPDGGPDPALLPEVRHGENVWLVPPANPAALAEAVRRLAGDPELRRRLGEGARALSKQFDWVNIAQRTLQLLNEVVHG